MNRLHVHLHVADLEGSVRFYTALFGQKPTKRESDYAKWMLEDPRVNFALSARGRQPGLGHLGIQVESKSELEAATSRAEAAAGTVEIEDAARCCYAVSDKSWAVDPQGIRWETFFTTGDIAEFGSDAQNAAPPAAPGACCGGRC